MTQTYRGSCHCGAVSYEVDIDLGQPTTKCNCTFCMKARAWTAFVRPELFRVTSGADRPTTYQKHPQAPLKHFCSTCGVYTYAIGHADYMGGEFVAVFLSSLDDAQDAELANAPVRYCDGRNNNWQNAPAETGYL